MLSGIIVLVKKNFNVIVFFVVIFLAKRFLLSKNIALTYLTYTPYHQALKGSLKMKDLVYFKDLVESRFKGVIRLRCYGPG